MGCLSHAWQNLLEGVAGTGKSHLMQRGAGKYSIVATQARHNHAPA